MRKVATVAVTKLLRVLFVDVREHRPCAAFRTHEVERGPIVHYAIEECHERARGDPAPRRLIVLGLPVVGTEEVRKVAPEPEPFRQRVPLGELDVLMDEHRCFELVHEADVLVVRSTKFLQQVVAEAVQRADPQP